jgi:hypothetical protein
VFHTLPTEVARRRDPPGQTKKFFLQVDGREVECFVVNYGENYCVCESLPPRPDDDGLDREQFLTEDGRYILCATRSRLRARYRECVFGPRAASFLTACRLQSTPIASSHNVRLKRKIKIVSAPFSIANSTDGRVREVRSKPKQTSWIEKSVKED